MQVYLFPYLYFYKELENYSIWDTTPYSYITTTDFSSSNFKHFEKAYKSIKKQ